MYLNNQIKHEDHVGVFESGLQNLQNSETTIKNSSKIQKNSENENQTFTMYLYVFCAEVSKILYFFIVNSKYNLKICIHLKCKSTWQLLSLLNLYDYMIFIIFFSPHSNVVTGKNLFIHFKLILFLNAVYLLNHNLCGINTF